MRRQYHGGQNARDWRRKVAALARKQKENVFTYKFKLDVQDGDIDFDAAAVRESQPIPRSCLCRGAP